MTAELEPLRRRIVMISGAPGVGKTTIARPLARALGMPLFAKDSIKERIHDVLADNGPVEVEWSRRLGAAAMEMLWLLAAEAPECVLEANFWPGHERQNDSLRVLSEGGTLIEVYCTAPREEILRRFHARNAAGERHAVHPDHAFTPDRWEKSFGGPIGVGRVLEVDTSTPVDVAKIAAEVRALLG
ncbi:AAA family ATPase [Catenulispora pinisilvae]|uniref:AAA family ATPase n=1 Tax=Catenulispora pinisilvae TaxID=2705253 RepID=UPI002B268019|nr:AAA family ATPase [Catenulispora pinisilvae]